MKYFNVKVEFKFEDENGKVKKQKLVYLTDAETVTEAEVRTVTKLKEAGEENFEVKSATQSNIVSVFNR